MPPTLNARGRTVARALLLGTAAALAAATPSQAYTPGVSPRAQTIVYPGTQTPIDAWKLAGTGSATNTLVAPRWVISSGHGAPQPGVTITLPTGDSAKVIAMSSLWKGETRRTIKGLDAVADISLALLDQALPAPSTGFPELLTDEITRDLNVALPGWVLWSGHGPNWSWPDPLVAWTRPDGTPEPGKSTVRAVDGDSGSTGLLFRTPTSTPLMPGVIGYGQRVAFGGSVRGGLVRLADARFTDVLKATASQPEETIADWLRREFAEHPSVAAPRFVSFAQAGIDLSTLVPPAPQSLAVEASTATTVKIGWKPQEEARIPLTGYRITVSPGDRTITVPPSTTRYEISGLEPTTQYTFTLRAYNASGTSVDSTQPDRQATISYRTRTVSPVRDLRFEAVRDRTLEDGEVRTAYCLRASWLPAQTDTGAPITGHRVVLDGVVRQDGRTSNSIDSTLSPDAAGRLSYRACGLEADSTHTIGVSAVSDQTQGPEQTTTGRTLAGAPRGTALTAPRNPKLVVERTVSAQATADYCQTVSWEAPVAIDGWPIASYGVVLYNEAAPAAQSLVPSLSRGDIPATERSFRACGVPPGTPLRAVVLAQYEGTIASTNAAATTTAPAGAPIGTPIPGPAGLAATTSSVITANGTADYCAQLTWSPPAAVDGFAVLSYVAVVLRAGAPVIVRPAPVGERSYEVCGLEPQTAYTTQLYALRSARGLPVSSEVEFTTRTGAPRGTPAPAPASPQLVIYGREAQGTLDYCATVSWAAPQPLAGYPVLGWSVSIVDTADASVVAEGPAVPLSARSTELCGLDTARRYSAKVAAIYGDTRTPVSADSPAVTAPVGAPRGTVVPRPTGLAVTVTVEGGQRCATLRWEAPEPLDGFEVRGYIAFFSGPGYLKYELGLQSTARAYKACGLPAGRISAYVGATLSDRLTPWSSVAFDATTGASLS